MMLVLLLMLVAAPPVAGQITDLTTSGDGAEVYFATEMRRKGTEESRQGRIYKVGAQGLELFAERIEERPVVPPIIGGGWKVGNYFSLSRPEVSRDGRVVALTGRRQCFGSAACGGVNTLETTVQGVRGRGEQRIEGAGRLSGNGRYVFLFLSGSVNQMPPTLVDLQTGERWTARAGPPQVSGEGRVVADNGIAVFTLFRQYLYVMRNGAAEELLQTYGNAGTQILMEQASIDAAGRVTVYAAEPTQSVFRTIRIYRLNERRDAAFIQGNGDSYAPTLSADGRRVMFISTAQFGTKDPSGTPQLYVVNIDGTGFRQASDDAAGVLRATMSDDGRVAWYVAGSGRLIKLDLDTGRAEEKIGRTPVMGPLLIPDSLLKWSGQGGRLVVGSAVALSGIGFSDRVWRAEEMPLPRDLGGVRVKVNGVAAPLFSVAPTKVVFQVPWETPAAERWGANQPEQDFEVETFSDTPFETELRVFSWAMTAFPLLLRLPEDRYGLFGGQAITLAVHEKWDALVTPSNPAHPGEVIHLYGTGFGRVEAVPETGLPASPDLPPRTVVPVTCWTFGVDSRLDLPVLYAGLAPGLVGYYQLSLRLPAQPRSREFFLACQGEAESGNFYGWLPISQ